MAYKGTKTPESERDSWSTPQFIFNWLNDTFEFDIDLAANHDNNKCKRYFTIEDNALEQDWHGFDSKTGFCNPPYSKISPWINKAISQTKVGFTTVMLIPTPNGESYYREVIENATEVIFITGRVAFIAPDGKPKSGNNRGSCVAIFRPRPFYTYAPPVIRAVERDMIKNSFT